jgi:hypothetical protein
MLDEINPTPASVQDFGVAKEETTPIENPAEAVQPVEKAPELQIEPEPQTAPADAEALAGRQMAPIEPTAQSDQIEPLVESNNSSILSSWIAKGREVIAGKKRKKLDKIMTLFEKKVSITNDMVEKFLHVSDATATRYLSILEKEGKIQRKGTTGKGVSYSKV